MPAVNSPGNTRYYVLGGFPGGDDTADGLTPSTPKLTLNGLKAAYNLAAGDIVNVGGLTLEAFTTTGQDTVTYQQWAGQPAWIHRGLREPTQGDPASTPPSTTGWTLHGGATWKHSIGAGQTVAQVVDRWVSRIFNTVQHGGWMMPIGVPAAASDISIAARAVTAVAISNPARLTITGHRLATGTRVTLSGFGTTPDINGTYAVTVVDANTVSIPVNVTAVSDGVGTATLTTLGFFAYDSAGGILYVRLSDDSNPNLQSGDDRVMWADGSLSVGFQLSAQTGCVVSGATFWGFLGTSVSALNIEGGTNPGGMASGCNFYDNQSHAANMTGSGPINSGQLQNCNFYGMGSETAASQTSHYNALGKINGGRETNIVMALYSLLDYQGNPLDATLSINGVYGHTDEGTGHTISDMEVNNLDVTCYTNPGTGGNFGDTADVL